MNNSNSRCGWVQSDQQFGFGSLADWAFANDDRLKSARNNGSILDIPIGYKESVE